MALSRSPSITQAPRPQVATIWGSIAGLFNHSSTLRDDETDADPESVSQSPQVPDSYTTESSSYPQPSTGLSQAPQISSSSTDVLHSTPRPIFKMRDFAYEPKPQIRDYPVDDAWVVPLKLPKYQSVYGMRERLGQQWEEAHKHLFRLEGNRADPPNTIPKTWGGLSKAEDRRMLRQAKERERDVERAKQAAAAFGLTPTEPNLGGPPPAPPLPGEEERVAAARAEAYLKVQEAEAKAAGHGPLVPTPPHTPEPEPTRRGFRPPPTHLTRPRTPSPGPSSPDLSSPGPSTPGRLKRKLDPSDDDYEVEEGRRKRQTRHQREEEERVGPSAPGRRGLRRRRADGAADTGPKTSPKGKGKGRER